MTVCATLFPTDSAPPSLALALVYVANSICYIRISPYWHFTAFVDWVLDIHVFPYAPCRQPQSSRSPGLNDEIETKYSVGRHIWDIPMNDGVTGQKVGLKPRTPPFAFTYLLPEARQR